MGMEAAGPGGRSAPLPMPPRLLLVRARSRPAGERGAAAAVSAGQDTPPRLSPVTVPFLWEDAPGKPKQQPRGHGAAAGAPPPAGVPATGGQADDGDGDAEAARPAPLRLPPRLQKVPPPPPSSDGGSPRSPNTVLHGPSFGCVGGGGRARRRPPLRRTGSLAAGLFSRRTLAAGAGLFASQAAKPTAAAPSTDSKSSGGHDQLDAAPWCGSPAASSASSSSPSSASTFFGDDNPPGHGGCGRPADGRDDSEEENEQGSSSVRITRFRRNRSLPSVTTSHLWATIRKSFKQITPWS